MKKIAITGILGYIGSKLAVDLLREGYEVFGVDNLFDPKVQEISDARFDNVDVRDYENLSKSIKDADCVLHLAALTGVEICDRLKDEALSVNTLGSFNVTRICAQRGIPIIYPSTVAMFGDVKKFPVKENAKRDPLNFYGKTKVISENLIRDMSENLGSFPSYIFIKTNLYGYHFVDGKMVNKTVLINKFVDSAISNRQLTLYKPGTQARDYVHMEDISRAYLLAVKKILRRRKGSVTMNIAAGKSHTLLDIANIVKNIANENNYKTEIKMLDNPRVEIVQDTFIVDTSKALKEIGFRVDAKLEDNVRRMFEQNGKGKRNTDMP